MRPHPSPVRVASGCPPGRWSRRARAIPRCGSSMAGCSLRAGADGDLDLTSAELYDPATATWSATADMLKPHAGFPATLLRDGKVLVGDVTKGATAPNCTTRPAGPGPLRGASTPKIQQFIRPPCWPTARCWWTVEPPDCTTPTAGPGPPPGIWYQWNYTTTLLSDGRVLVVGGEFPSSKAASCTTRTRGRGRQPRICASAIRTTMATTSRPRC